MVSHISQFDSVKQPHIFATLVYWYDGELVSHKRGFDSFE